MRAHKILEAMETGRLQLMSRELSKIDPPEKIMTNLHLQIQGSRKFFMGGEGDIPHSQPAPTYSRLPYPLCYFERENTVPGGTGVVALLALEVTQEMLAITKQTFFPEHPEVIPYWLGQSFMFEPRTKFWVLSPFTTIVYEQDGEMGVMLEPDTKEMIPKTEALLEFGCACAGMVCVFLKMLACSNVKAEKIPAPEKLNKHRAAQNRPPIFEYHVLTVPNKSAKGEAQGGTHSSPRFHFRRGHVRHLGPEKLTWVRDCAVGSTKRGVVEKEYVNVTKGIV